VNNDPMAPRLDALVAQVRRSCARAERVVEDSHQVGERSRHTSDEAIRLRTQARAQLAARHRSE
jgi:hypothetical protein